jgi:hypothetical protein
MQDVGREKVKNQPLDDSFRLMEKLVSNVRSEALPEQPRKEIYLCRASSLQQPVVSIKPTSKHFGLLLVMDAVSLPDAALFQAAKDLISKGLVYLCAWGPDCERVHDRVRSAMVLFKLCLCDKELRANLRRLDHRNDRE